MVMAGDGAHGIVLPTLISLTPYNNHSLWPLTVITGTIMISNLSYGSYNPIYNC